MNRYSILFVIAIVLSQNSCSTEYVQDDSSSVRTQIIKNITGGMDLTIEAEKHLESINCNLQKARVLAVKSANGIYDYEGRYLLNVEFIMLLENISLEIQQSSYKDTVLLNSLDNKWHGSIPITVSEKSRSLYIGLPKMSPDIYGIFSIQNPDIIMKVRGENKTFVPFNKTDAHVGTIENAENSIRKIDEMLYKISFERARLRAYYNRLDFCKKLNEGLKRNKKDITRSIANSIEDRILVLATQSANGTYTDKDRALIQIEFEELKDELSRIKDVYSVNPRIDLKKDDHIKDCESAERLRLKLIQFIEKE